jgi:endogenous inhibitor of DNA gyrase (YacG/DUF329 family)
MTDSKKKKCPQCGQDIPVKSNYFPFCSERCKMLDLGAWAAEKYRTPSSEPNNTSEEEGQ